MYSAKKFLLFLFLFLIVFITYADDFVAIPDFECNNYSELRDILKEKNIACQEENGQLKINKTDYSKIHKELNALKDSNDFRYNVVSVDFKKNTLVIKKFVDKDKVLKVLEEQNLFHETDEKGIKIKLGDGKKILPMLVGKNLIPDPYIITLGAPVEFDSDLFKSICLNRALCIQIYKNIQNTEYADVDISQKEATVKIRTENKKELSEKDLAILRGLFEKCNSFKIELNGVVLQRVSSEKKNYGK